jgi:2,4-dienoyl-CoA reductase-like NADH-dependent reductase (Old Yellow Enzyme family)
VAEVAAYPRLLEPLTLRGVTVPNRVMMSPMCQNRAGADGLATPWHLVHYGSRAMGGVGLVMVEDCGIVSEGRLNTTALGIYDDAQIAPLAQIVDFCHSVGATVGLQLGHAGRKAFAPHKGRGPAATVGPTDEAFAPDWVTPVALGEAGCQQVVDAFGVAARRALQAGFDLVEVHAGHGYLLHEFLSPLTNTRTDAYGGTPQGRARLLREVVDRVRAECPEQVPVFARLSVVDPEPGGLALEDVLDVVTDLRERGIDVIDVSSGGLTASPVGAHTADQPALSARLKKETGVRTIAVGSVTEPQIGEDLLTSEVCDIVAVGRALLANPFWLRPAIEAFAAATS